MKLPDSLAALEWVCVLSPRSDRWLLDLAGVPAWGWSYPQGITLAIEIELEVLDDAWLQRVCLWLASIRTNLDDGLLLERGKLYLVRRHEHGLSAVEWEATLNQQLAVVAWLVKHASSVSSIGSAAGRRV
ncbi:MULTISPECIES: hypothetical protein [Chromobacterium]|uniref:Uncharacterized protein n=1 Tax=Chromobacterium violaceum (strain ATCC 12472 / DSM 30191 / JCM 1249 / CCUG 213 / NBRC 12614 / NCIMB 9131 / NCTC 9757 / MK) TaxID=243365 RepID=Q7NUU9_CHRVO|nr:hypothetical protein [Chromobacterium violaceum]AAQ60268.1 hypothetical protein CV_2598 [Chromobacterium violaceum ATCC 12472]